MFGFFGKNRSQSEMNQEILEQQKVVNELERKALDAVEASKTALHNEADSFIGFYESQKGLIDLFIGVAKDMKRSI